VSALLGVDYTMGQASYDLRRLRMKGLIVRLEHSNTYVLTPDGVRVAVFYTKVHDRLLRPLLAADRPPAPLPSGRPYAPSTTPSTTTSTTPESPPENSAHLSIRDEPNVPSTVTPLDIAEITSYSPSAEAQTSGSPLGVTV
jgi:hypothetical protein